MSTTKRCSTCGNAPGICTCTGCQSVFCPSHFNDHRRQMSAQLESIKENCNQVAMKTQETIQTQRNGSSLLSQIDEWEKSTIEKIVRAADNARQQAIQLMRRKKTEIIEGLNTVNGEIRTRQGADDYFEQDLERLKKAVNKIHNDLDQFIRRPIELTVKKNDQSEWNSLITVNHYSTSIGNRNFQEPVVERAQTSARREQSARSEKLTCRRLGG